MEIHITKEEQFIFTAKLKKILGILLVVGLVIAGLGIWQSMAGSDHGAEGHGTEGAHIEMEASDGRSNEIAHDGTGDPTVHDEAAHGGEHPVWLRRLYANLWINNVYFTGFAVIGLFFVAIQYVAQAGWSAGILRVPLAMAAWLPIAGVLMLVVFLLGGHDLFHWTHEYLFDPASPDYDEVIAGKEGYLNTFFYIGRMVAYFVIWTGAFFIIRKQSLQEDLHGGTSYWYALRKYSAIFIVLFAVTSSTSAWDWVMSVDPHWFSTMFGWYVFASWWVSGLALITFLVVMLKDYGYLKIVNANHLHDLGKFVFAFSIFWTYIWFSQFLLIYYANIPEESIYYIERLSNDKYAPVFFLNLIVNFVFPFFVLMTRDAKRLPIFLKIVCAIIIFGHWLDFYLMITPGVMKDEGGIGLLEIGMLMVYGCAFLFVTFVTLSKSALVQKNHPMLEESIHHHI